ncbi:MAG TPA: hypothetical protein VE961_07930 [Pyrinomonadaceae bacterium]|nr:hypothetical protein [Pyrinomonadaceae bacterium]
MDSQIGLQQPVLDGAIQSINFFNGRLLSARDLTVEQNANREASRRLGRAIGAGVAYGLEVSKASNFKKDSPAVSVEAGLAINPNGQTLSLSARTDVALVRSSNANGAAQIFGDCLPLQTGSYVSGAGVYLLTIAPAQSVEGRAITNGLQPGASSCSSDTLVSTVQFRLVQIDSALTPAQMNDQAHLRNLVAYKCFGVDDTKDFVADPFAKEMKQWGLLDGLRPNQLTDCEVPLAVLYWTDLDGLNFIDMWSVRRRLIEPAAGAPWPFFYADRRSAEAEAMFLQFQDQIKELQQNTNPALVNARGYFSFLPPIGFLPIGSGATAAFDYKVFFQDKIHRDDSVFIEGAQVCSLMRDALSYPPIDLNSQEMVWLYLIRENIQLFDLGAAKRPQQYVIFVNGHTQYRGNARYDLNRWNFGNYGEI